MLANLRSGVEGRHTSASQRPSAAPVRRTCAHSRPGGRRTTVVVRADGDYYDLLGVPRGSDKKTIKQAYRQKARKFHPDVNKDPGAEDLFKKIGEAYEVLSDDNKKVIYDKYGEAGLKGGMGGMGGGPGVEFTNPFDLFESFFGGNMGGMGGMSGMGGFGGQQRSRSRAVPGEDDKVDLQLDFLEAVFGCARELDVDRLTGCEECDTTGMRKGTTASTCPQCQGTGQVVQAVRTPLGTFQQVSLCPRCEGTGQVFSPCTKCQGDGRVRETKRISLKVPAGVDAGSRLRVRGEGNSGRRGGEPGDLYVYISIKDHPELRRDGITIHSDVEISYVDAILGTQVKVTTVDGPVELKIPAGTQPGTTLLMAKRGVPRLGSANVRGDHMVHVRVRIPKTVTAEERKLVEELKELQSKTKVGPFRF